MNGNTNDVQTPLSLLVSRTDVAAALRYLLFPRSTRADRRGMLGRNIGIHVY